MLTRKDHQEIRRGLDNRRRNEQDIEYWEYIGPVGSSGLHRARPPHSSQSKVIGSSLGGKTFRPGSVVPVGSHSGRPGKFIIGGPPPGLRGSSKFAGQVASPWNLPLKELIVTCPTESVTGKTYIGTFTSSSAFFAEIYNDHTATGTKWSKSHSLSPGALLWRVHDHPNDVVVGYGPRDSDTVIQVVSWNLDTDTLTTIDTTIDEDFASPEVRFFGPCVRGTTIYWCKYEEGPPAKLTLYKASVGSTSYSTVGSITSDGNVDWESSSGNGVMAAVGVDDVLVAGIDSAASVGSRGVWSRIASGTLRHGDTFDESNFARGAADSLGDGAFFKFDDDSLAKVNSAGQVTKYSNSDTWEQDLYGTPRVSPDGSEVLIWPTQMPGGDFDQIMRIAIQDYTGLSVCQTAGTGSPPDDMTDLPFIVPDWFLPKD